jgi:hypothetical protein
MPGLVAVTGKLDLTAWSARTGAAAAAMYLKLSLVRRLEGLALAASNPADNLSNGDADATLSAVCC